MPNPTRRNGEFHAFPRGMPIVRHIARPMTPVTPAQGIERRFVFRGNVFQFVFTRDRPESRKAFIIGVGRLDLFAISDRTGRRRARVGDQSRKDRCNCDNP
jgi:hypothetical protein